MVEFYGFSVTPDVGELIDVLWRRKRPKRVHFIELFHDPEVIRHIDERFMLTDNLDKNDPYYALRLNIVVNQFLGFDVFSGAWNSWSDSRIILKESVYYWSNIRKFRLKIT